MKKKFIAFYDVLFFSIIAGVMLTIAILIFAKGEFSNMEWLKKYWYLVLAFATCISVPYTAIFCLQKMTIDLNCNKVKLFYLVNFAKNDLDLYSNWIIYPSEIESIEIVKLSKEEKKKYTSAKFLFNKYLKINLKYGHVKYIYISHYSKYQRKKIIKLLTSKTNTIA